MTVALQTKLGAVNIMLKAIGETPVSSLSSGQADAERAEEKLDEVSRELQEQGWTFNTDVDITKTRTASNHIVVGSTILRADTSGRDRNLCVDIRVDDTDGIRKYWDIDNNTFVWTRDLIATEVSLLEFESLPEAAKNFVAYAAAVSFQTDVLGSVAIDSFTSRRKADTWAQLMDYQVQLEDNNALHRVPSLRFGGHRRTYRYR